MSGRTIRRVCRTNGTGAFHVIGSIAALAVDDEALVRFNLAQTLEAEGYRNFGLQLFEYCGARDLKRLVTFGRKLPL